MLIYVKVWIALRLDRSLKGLQGYDLVERTETKLILNTIFKRGLMFDR